MSQGSWLRAWFDYSTMSMSTMSQGSSANSSDMGKADPEFGKEHSLRSDCLPTEASACLGSGHPTAHTHMKPLGQQGLYWRSWCSQISHMLFRRHWGRRVCRAPGSQVWLIGWKVQLAWPFYPCWRDSLDAMSFRRIRRIWSSTISLSTEGKIPDAFTCCAALLLEDKDKTRAKEQQRQHMPESSQSGQKFWLGCQITERLQVTVGACSCKKHARMLCRTIWGIDASSCTNGMSSVHGWRIWSQRSRFGASAQPCSWHWDLSWSPVTGLMTESSNAIRMHCSACRSTTSSLQMSLHSLTNRSEGGRTKLARLHALFSALSPDICDTEPFPAEWSWILLCSLASKMPMHLSTVKESQGRTMSTSSMYEGIEAHTAGPANHSCLCFVGGSSIRGSCEFSASWNLNLQVGQPMLHSPIGMMALNECDWRALQLQAMCLMHRLDSSNMYLPARPARHVKAESSMRAWWNRLSPSSQKHSGHLRSPEHVHLIQTSPEIVCWLQPVGLWPSATFHIPIRIPMPPLKAIIGSSRVACHKAKPGWLGGELIGCCMSWLGASQPLQDAGLLQAAWVHPETVPEGIDDKCSPEGDALVTIPTWTLAVWRILIWWPDSWIGFLKTGMLHQSLSFHLGNVDGPSSHACSCQLASIGVGQCSPWAAIIWTTWGMQQIWMYAWPLLWSWLCLR